MTLTGSIGVYFGIYILLVVVGNQLKASHLESVIACIVSIMSIGWLFIACGCLYLGFRSGL